MWDHHTDTSVECSKHYRGHVCAFIKETNHKRQMNKEGVGDQKKTKERFKVGWSH